MTSPTPETLSVRLRRRIRRSGSSDYLSESDADDIEALELRLAEAERKGGDLCNLAGHQMIEIHDLKERLAEAEKARQERERHTYCAYCGEQYPLDDPGTPMAVTRHIFACPKHPMAEIRRRLVSRVWGNCTLGTTEELEAQALIDYIDESAALAPGPKTEGET